MDHYYELIEALAPLDRCHCGLEMEKAYSFLTDYYQGARLIKYPCKQEIYNWILPPYWECKKAVLKDSYGKVIADKSRGNLEVFSYSPSFKGEIELNELQDHLLSDPNRPDSTIFHFRNQYRHWAPEWGFSIPHHLRETLKNDTYFVEIDSHYKDDEEVIQADYYHEGSKKHEFLFIGHFDHPSMVNDGLAGSVAAFEVINRLKGKKTKYSYRAFASVEIVGSAAYLANETSITPNLKEALFLGFAGIESSMVYQQSFHENSKIDRAVNHLLKFKNGSQQKVFRHRELVGNDENIFDSVGYEIPTGTLLRYPFPEYHSNYDNMEITRESKIEEIIAFTFKVIDILEHDAFITANYKGVPCLSNPDINLYLSPDKMSNLLTKDQLSQIDLHIESQQEEKDYLSKNTHLLYSFMNNVIRMANGQYTILDICEKSDIPFSFGLLYIKKLEEKNIITINEN